MDSLTKKNEETNNNVDELEKKQNNYSKIRNQPVYTQHINYLDNLITQFIASLRTTLTYMTRFPTISNNSLLIRNLYEFLESAVATSLLLNEGVINPAIRELRYLIEASIKYLAVDQQCSKKTYDERINYLHNKIDRSSISPIHELKMFFFHDGEFDDFKNYVIDHYKKLCAYTHPSKKQIVEYSRRTLGFETPKEIEKFTRLLFKTYEIVLILIFEDIGYVNTGDLFINVFDNKKIKWKFYRSKFIKKVSKFYDYKSERK